MPLSTLAARQGAAGAAVRVGANNRLLNYAEYHANFYSGIGVTHTATIPTNVSEFAATYKDPVGDLVAYYSGSSAYNADGAIRQAYQARMIGVLPYGGEIVAGHYLWAFNEGDAGALQSVSDPYLIT